MSTIALHRVALRLALAAGIVGMLVMAPLSADASPSAIDNSACAGTVYAEGSDLELFAVPGADIPGPLQSFDWSCAARNVTVPYNAFGYLKYTLLLVNPAWADVLDVVSALDAMGWHNANPGDTVTTGLDDQTADVFGRPQLTLDELRQVDPPSYFGNFVTSRDGQDTVQLDYFDGVQYVIDESFRGTPVLTAQVHEVSGLAPATGIGDPSVLSGLRTIQSAVPTPQQALLLGASAVVLMLIVGWPGSMLTAVLSRHYDKLFGWTTRRFPARIRATLKKNQPRWLVWVGFVVAAVVAGFVDPSFGVNPLSARLVITGFATFAIFNLLGSGLVSAIVKRVQPESKPVLNFRWASLIIVILAIVAARLLQFQPGVIFGLVAGLSFAITLVASREALVVLVGSGFALVVALLAWAGYSVLAPLAGSSGNPALVTVSEFLSGLTIEGISSLPIALLPFAIVDGGKLFRWNRWLWGVAYAVGIAAFMFVLFTIPSSFGTIGDYGRWVVLFIVFGVVAVAAWVIDGAGRRRKSARAATV